MASNASTNIDGTRTGPTCQTISSEEQDFAGTATGELAVGEVGVCKFFLEGRCHFGNRCHLSHSVTPSGAKAFKNVEKGQYLEEGQNKKKSGKKKNSKTCGTPSKSMEREELSKKPRMRPANEVVSRILWDPSLNPEDFSVGYLDRFLGVLERPFAEFSWDRDLCNCNYSEELALPQHRIKYFIYKGKKIWDRESRMDGVFGSTGGPIFPPFVAEEPGEEASTTVETAVEDVEVEAENLEENLYNTAKEPLNKSHSVLPENTSNVKSLCVIRTEEEKTLCSQEVPHCSLSEVAGGDNSGTPHSCFEKIDLREQGKQIEEIEVASTDNAATPGPELYSGLMTLPKLTEDNEKDVKEENDKEEEWKESWDGEEEKEELSWHVDLAQQGPISPATTSVLTQSGPLEQRRKSSRRRPTHFITFRADSSAFIAGFLCLQEEVTAVLPLSQPHWVSPEKLHVTLCLLVLHEPWEVNAACELLREFVRKHQTQPLSITCSPKLSTFGGRVLYLTPQPLHQIHSLNSPLLELFEEKGWLHRDSLSPIYHLTLAKETGMDGERIFEGVWKKVKRIEKVRAIDFGTLTVNKLYFCAMSTGTGGFYETLCTVSL